MYEYNLITPPKNIFLSMRLSIRIYNKYSILFLIYYFNINIITIIQCNLSIYIKYVFIFMSYIYYNRYYLLICIAVKSKLYLTLKYF